MEWHKFIKGIRESKNPSKPNQTSWWVLIGKCFWPICENYKKECDLAPTSKGVRKALVIFPYEQPFPREIHIVRTL